LTDLGNLLELMHGAVARVRSVDVTFVERRRPKLLEQAFVQFAEQVEMAAGGGYFHTPLGGSRPGEEADEHIWEIDLTAEPGCFRQLRRGPDMDDVLVVNGDRWWSWSPAFGLSSHEAEPGLQPSGGLHLLDGSAFLSGHALELAGESVVAGRHALNVRVLGFSDRHRSPVMQPGVEQAELLVDADSGIVLRRAELVDGEEAFLREVESIRYDQPHADEIFVFELPPGASTLGAGTPQVGTIDAVAARAAFRVFKLEKMPLEWRVQAVYMPAIERPTVPDSVTLIYTRPDGGQQLQIRERSWEHDLPAKSRERRFERGGRQFIALGPDRPIGREPAELIFAIDGTHVRLSSPELTLEELLEFAERLVPA
jgi:hypothetical protein